jgi:hypothetical protein
MSIDFLFELERQIDNGKSIYACPGLSRDQWVMGKGVDELRKTAQRAADSRKMSVQVFRLISKHDAVTGAMYLVPTHIDEPGSRGEPQIKWRQVETKDAAEMMRDVRHGPSPYFAMEVEETVEPTAGV